MATIYLIRHGQKFPNSGDPSLTEVGVGQAKETGEYLKQFPISRIISSPFKRTIETAIQIAGVLNLEFSLDDGLAERMNWNDPTVSRQEFLQEWIRATNDREYVSKFGDSSVATGQRVDKLIRKSLWDCEHAVVITHGGAILDFLRNLFGDESIQTLRTRYDEGEDYKMMNCAINKVALSNPPTLELLNFTDHLTTKSE